MSKLELIATATFGLEAIVKREIIALGYEIKSVEDGKITYWGDEAAIARCNLWLRSADRVFLKIGEFKAHSFEELFQQTKALPWENWIPKNGEFPVNGKSLKSKLYSVSDCQAIVKKAIVEKLKEKYKLDWFEETGSNYTIQVAILKDVVTLTIDTSGSGLHKRGYRTSDVAAPLKETLAAALVQLSYWRKDRILLDPFCGSGTIPIEAALIGKNIAPGINRTFASEKWSQIPESIWKKARKEAYDAIDQTSKLSIVASDIDASAIASAKKNASLAGVADCITFETKDIADVTLPGEYGVAICNPPYGERIGEKEELVDLYKKIRQIFKEEPTWSLYLITSDERFETLYSNKPCDRRRKLYNGRIKIDYYQYYGQRPPKSEAQLAKEAARAKEKESKS